MNETIRRELQVAFSKKAQPVWFRIAKWVIFLAGCIALYSTGYLWFWIFGLLAVGLGVHMLYRWKTQAWTRPWGMWDDVKAGRK
jgi:Ca2+-dependent lipid-binding protein